MKLSDLSLHDIGNTIQISGTIFSGNGFNFLVYFPEEDPEQNTMVTLDLNLDEWKIFLQQTDQMETEILAKAHDGSITKAIVRKSQRQIEQRVSWKVFKRDGYTCRYCGNDDTPLTVDHVVLWEEGGPSIEENLVSACKKCNKTRGNTLYGDWLKSTYYLRVSTRLEKSVKELNESLVNVLNTIPRKLHVTSR